MPYANAFYPFKIRGEYPRVLIAQIKPKVVAAGQIDKCTFWAAAPAVRQFTAETELSYITTSIAKDVLTKRMK